MPPTYIAATRPDEGLSAEDNKLRPEDRPAHDWYRFVLSFPPHLVRQYIRKFGITASDRVLDPFCGTGTTLVECKKQGISCVGIERNPMAVFASSVKINWGVAPDDLLEHAGKVADTTAEKLLAEGTSDYAGLPLWHNERDTPNRLRQLPPDKQKLILGNSISPLPLHKTLVLQETLRDRHNARLSQHEQLALAKAVVFQISNLHFGPEVGVHKPKADAAVVPAWLDVVRAMAEDLRVLNNHADNEAVVFQADSREPIATVEPNSIDAVITSPPYPNEKDYTRTTRLESVLLGLIRDRNDLRMLKKGLIRSNTRGVYKGDSDDLLVADNAEIQRIATMIESRRLQLGKTSGFERQYAKVTRLYFGGITRHLAQLRPALRTGARLAYVVGDQASYLRVMIRTGKLIAKIAESLGYEVAGIDLFRTRLSTATKQRLREEVVCLRWPGG